jgi:HD-GYP domain-containing protein (c-di-GMP phosphodiesterase class II)
MAQPKILTMPDLYVVTTASPETDAPASVSPASASPAESVIHRPRRHEAEPLPPSGPGCSEIAQAIDLLNNLALATVRIHRAARRKQALNLRPLKQAIAALIQNFVDDPNSLFWALAANRRMYHLSRRSVGCAVWALAFGRQLKLESTALQELMLGAALLDIGKLNVPIVILAKASVLNKAEQKFARRHVGEGMRLLESVDGLSEEAMEMVRSHHERIDGSGYPYGLKGDEISLFAQIAGIVDSFDALSLSRYYAEGLSGHAAISTLKEQGGAQFSAALLDDFVSAIGEFPTGTWVEFPDGRTGVVCSQDPEDQHTPKVVLIADEQQQPILAVHWLQLHEHGEARVLPPAERPNHAAAMERSLQAGIYARGPRKYL